MKSETTFQTGITFSYEQNLPEKKRVNANSLDIVFNAHVRWKPIVGFISPQSF